MAIIQGKMDIITTVSAKQDMTMIISGNIGQTTLLGTLSTVMLGQMSPYTLVSGNASWTPNLQGSLTGQVLTTAVKSSALYKKVLASSGDIYTSSSLIKTSNIGKA